MKERSSRFALTTYGIALAVVSAIIGLVWFQKKPEVESVQNQEQVKQGIKDMRVPETPPVQGGTVDAPVLGTVTTATPADPYGPLGPFGPGGPGGPAGPAGPSGTSGNTPPE